MTYNLNTHIKAIKANVGTLAGETASFFERRVELQGAIGTEFAAILDHERITDEKMTPNGCYVKHAALLKPIIGQTILVNECYVIAMAQPKAITAALKTYKAVGVGAKSKNTDGTVKMRTDFFAEAVRADADKRWDKTTGEVKKLSGNAKTNKQRQADAEKKVVVAMTELGGLDTEWDLRYLVVDELNTLETAIKAERLRRSMGGKVLVLSS